MNRTRCAHLMVALAGVLFWTTTATAVDFAEKRGDIWYDNEGHAVAIPHVERAEHGDVSHLSWLEKFAMGGVELPARGAFLQPRHVLAKPAQVDARERLMLDRLIVKFVDEAPVRLRSGSLLREGAAMPAVDAALAQRPGATIRRLFQAEERVLAENKDSGERISGKVLPDLNHFYLISFPSRDPGNAILANELLALDSVEMAYFQAPGEEPACADLGAVTPLWETNQFYRDPAPTGIDIEAAWAYDPGGDGAGNGFWVVDCEWGWCFDHEDMDLPITDVLNGESGGSDPDHGSAVMGIIGACDNDYGVTGLTPDVNLKMADFSSDSTWAETIQTAANALLTGEVMLLEIHILGADTGLSCPCNCSQFEFVPVEWDGASFAAIQTAVANGVVVVEAGGNGSTDLDATAHGGAFNRNLLDSGAIVVGAASPAGHFPECWTNYGSRIDVHAFGSSLYTCGLSNNAGHQNLTGCDQDYTDDFGGTSGASPIIVGACVSLQGIANNKWGFDLTPWEMRDLLQIDGTPQGVSTKYIGPMPDLAAILPALAPDLLASYTPSGWSYPVVPRLTSDASGSSAVLPNGALPGNTTGTYWNWATRNAAPYTSTNASTTTELSVDDNPILYCTTAEYLPNQWRWCGNSGGALTTKGGRHTVRSNADYLAAQEEGSETNNAWVRQFIWSGMPLTNGTPATRTSDPPAQTTGWGPWFNGEGFSGTTGIPYWYVFATMPTDVSEDFDIRLNTETPGNVPIEGFGAHVAYSTTPAGEIAYVVLDRNQVGSGTYYASVLNFDGATSDKVVEFSSDQGTLSTPGTFGPFTLGAGDLTKVHEVLLPVSTQTRIQIEVVSGSVDYGISLHGDGSGFYPASTVVPGGTADLYGGGQDESIVVEPTTNEFRGLVVWKKNSSQVASTLTYNVIITQDPNLLPAQPAGWFAPAVPRASTDASAGNVPLPALLPGNVAGTSFNWALINVGPNDAAASWSTISVDDVARFISLSGTLAPGATHLVTNTALIAPEAVVRGGRHHVRSAADSPNSIVEYDETDNDYANWYVWTPEAIADGPFVQRPTPSLRDPIGFGPYFSGDGFRSTRDPGKYWTAVGVMPLSNADDYDVRMHDMSAGSRDGFGTYRAWAHDAAVGAPDFTVVNYNHITGVDLDYSVLNWSGTGDCLIQEVDAFYSGAVGPGVTDLGTFSMGTNEFMEIHEFQIALAAVGLPVTVSLEPVSGSANLDLRLYDPGTTYTTKLAATATGATAGPGGVEEVGPFSWFEVDFPAVVVHRASADDLGSVEQYRIVVTVGTPVDVPTITGTPTIFSLQSARPNPFGGSTSIRYDVRAGGAETRLEIYDVQGRRLSTLVDGWQPAGRHSVRWYGTDEAGHRLGAGVYFIRMKADSFRSTRKLLLLK